MRASTAYFVGGGTIVAAIAIGLGGGIVAGNIMNPVAPKQGPDASKQERRAAPVTTADASSARVQYLTGSQVFGAVIATPAHAGAPTASANAEPQTPSPTVANETKPASTPAAQPTKPVEQQASTEPVPAPENAYAKAKDGDMKRAASERRRADRRQRWAERHRYDMHDRTDWDDVARNVREDADAREFTASPRRGYRQSPGYPQIRLFGSDNDD
jgi:hypothetical protein